MNEFKIGDTSVGYKHPVFIVAEISSSHCQDVEKGKKLIKYAKDARANAVKIQAYLPESMTIDCKNDYFKIKDTGLWDGNYLYDLYKKGYLTREQQLELKKYADEIGITLFASAFSKEDVDFLENEMKVEAYKVASFEITDVNLISYMASKGKPIIISTGIANWLDIWGAINACTEQNNYVIALLKCSSTYPTPDDEVNLFGFEILKMTYPNYVIGFSDHTQDEIAVLSATTLGAKIIEKHIEITTFDDDDSLDSEFSFDVIDFAYMVSNIRRIEKMIGNGRLELTKKQKNMRKLSRSLFVVEDINMGEKFTKKNVRSIRPGYGMHPKFYNSIMDKTARCDIERGTPLTDIIIKEK